MRGPIAWQKPSSRGYAIEEWEIEGRATALLLLDLQTANVDPSASAVQAFRGAFPEQSAYYFSRIQDVVLPTVRKLHTSFREARLPVVYACSGLVLPEGAELASWSWRSARLRQDARPGIPSLLPPGAEGREVWPPIAPLPDDLVLFKPTLSPFNGTALDQYLRNMRIENLVLAGVLTNGAVETTARNAGDRGFNVIVVEDACAALSPEDHAAGTKFTSWYVVKSADDTLEALAPLV